MTYKWEAIAQDLTEERDRLLKERNTLREVLTDIVRLISKYPFLFSANEVSMKAYLQSARAALKSEKQ